MVDAANERAKSDLRFQILNRGVRIFHAGVVAEHQQYTGEDEEQHQHGRNAAQAPGIAEPQSRFGHFGGMNVQDQVIGNGAHPAAIVIGGGGRFVVEALDKGYSVTGAEYNPDLVANLSKTFTKASFLTIDDFYKSDAKYDIIFLSNVLEHLTNPKEIMLKLRERVSENGLFVLEGPVENNFNLTLLTRKIIFFIRKNFFGKKASHTPTHILYANRKNQEQFLKDIGLTTLYYEIKESNWPYPMRYEDCHSLMQKLMYGIAAFSVAMSKIFPFWGNNFVYIGKVK